MTLEEFREGLQREKNRREQERKNLEAIERNNSGALVRRRREEYWKFKRRHKRK